MYNYKHTLLLLLILLCPSLQSTIHAQVSAMHMRMHQQAMYTNDMMRRFRTQGMDIGNTKKTQAKYKFYIVNLNGDTLDTKKKIKIPFYQPISKLTYKNKSGEISFTPDQTKEIFVKKLNRTISGIENGGYWAFKTFSTSSLNLYAPFPEDDINFVTHYQLKGDSIRVLTIESAEKIVAGNEKAMKALKKKKLHNAMKIYLKSEMKRKNEIN
ncbi:hypothetical protein [Dysgonomonas sp. ZJ709]|uniref:hypothetical protein n=1 Tax=Dysgonomonas sp. ZJ709 TaxID=2709797 RepID=UPI0013EB25F2|nr:hypothetical protein [Dysgonomonas sp. ZJ709]